MAFAVPPDWQHNKTHQKMRLRRTFFRFGPNRWCFLFFIWGKNRKKSDINFWNEALRILLKGWVSNKETCWCFAKWWCQYSLVVSKGTKNNGITVGRHIFYQTFTEVQTWRVQREKSTEQSFLFWWKHKLTLIFTNSCNVEISGRRLFFWTDTQSSCVCVSLWFRQSTSLAFLKKGFGLSTNKWTFTITAMSRTTIFETYPPFIYLFIYSCFGFVFFFFTSVHD